DALLAEPEPRAEIAPPPAAWAPAPAPPAWTAPAHAFSTPPLPLPPQVEDEAPPPSIAPVTASVEIVSGARARELVAASANASAPTSAGRVLLVGLCLLVAGLAMGVAIAFAFPDGPLGRLLHVVPRGGAVAAAASPPPVASPAPVAASPAPVAAARAVPSGGVLVLPPNAAGHRVWIDRTVVDGSSRTIEVPCGPHKVKIGSHGHARRVVIPCGGTLTL
ncbi:MAG: hypothetical protein KC657_39935, partial [Myxococcales bacterium]|nr:hypothetical protein [Myxococcales bacterium]